MNTIQKKLTKSFTTCLITVFIFSVTSLTARAESAKETEPNDTMETAETIIANNETPSGTVSGKYTGQYVVEGYTSTKDTDWFKVFLNAGTNYMTCNGDSYTFRITDSDGVTILTDTFAKTGYGPTAYRFTAPTAGYYYVELNGTTSISDEYLFMIGSPTYGLAHCTIPCVEGTVSMTSGGGTQVAHFDGSTVSGVPEDAIAYTVSMSGITLNGTSSVSVENEDKGLSFTLTMYTWDKNNLVSMDLPVDSIWTARFGYNKVTSFTPSLRVYYVYPVYDHMLNS